ncbi:hypothetical protein HRG_002462 [Hirsutella rhossiliensis]|uniref:Uncharacterized protein n=1 Tax=Hirsutella rhossiliensis TaxID=111463 RepID=A0A9P8SL36_9HYPO|nr:uncharacterized protein HRG_02462 [Hirsutella rhossiliensis]KAH0967053.1 hypothetical protein HRG_02462 [Hirsutella rhossiliensis]
MDAAAKTVESLSQHILPEKPHHLSYNPHWRYRPRPDDAAHGSRSGTRFEEWHNTRLQYMTLVSHADRGTLLTRSYYDMREEPPKPVPREVSALAKAGGDKKKKLSLSDYKNKKTGAASSASPPEPAIAKRKEGDRLLAGPAAPPLDAVAGPRPTSADAKPPLDSHKPTSDFRKPDVSKLPDSQPPPFDAKQRPRESAIDMRLPPKPPSLPPKPPSPPAKKRVADIEDESRPQKRAKPDDRRLADRPPPPRDDALRRKERPQPAARDAPLHKEDRPTSSSSLPNGRAIFKGALHPTRNPSPGARPRGDAVNGVRPHSSGSNISTSAKPDTSKSFVPPLLSPLKLSFDGDSRPHPDDDDLSARKEKRRRDDSGDSRPTIKAVKKPEPPSGSKKNKVPLVIPPLLSPTLPPAVEAELRRRKKVSPESADEKPKDGKDAPGAKKRPASGANDEKSNKLGHRRRLMVVLSIPKGLRQSVKRILALPTDRKDAHSQDRERGRERDRERDRPGSDEPPQATQARKRPAGTADVPTEPTAIKRPRTSDVARVAATPSTPSKRSTAMSRVSSGNSMAQTPGEAVNATPMAAPSADRKPNGHDPSAQRPERPEIKTLADVELRLKRKAVSLKHDSDEIMRVHRGSPNGTGAKGNPSESRLKLKYALGVESILAFVMSFQAQNAWRGMLNKKLDYQSWDSVLPLIEYTHNEIRGHGLNNSKPLYVLVLVLHAIVIDELIKCYASLDVPPPSITLEGLLKLERRKARLWPTIRDLNAHIGSSTLRVEVSPWFSIDEVTGSGLRVLRNWCSEERVDWTPEPILKDSWPINPRHP